MEQQDADHLQPAYYDEISPDDDHEEGILQRPPSSSEQTFSSSPLTDKSKPKNNGWMDFWRTDKRLIKDAFRATLGRNHDQKPRGPLHAIYKASRSAAMGFLVGVMAIGWSLPFSWFMALFDGWKAALRTSLMGTGAGLVAMAVGIRNALVQCFWGILQWPRSFATWWSDVVWNPKTGDYALFQLDQYRDEIIATLQYHHRTLPSTTSTRSYYRLLGVPPYASKGDLQRAYRRRARKYHPDKQTNETDAEEATGHFDRLTKAYRTLSDPHQRERYDKWGEDLLENLERLPPFDPSVFSSTLFGTTQHLQAYTGKLFLESFSQDVYYFLMYAQGEYEKYHSGGGGGGGDPRLWSTGAIPILRKALQVVSSYSLDTDLRQAQIATHIRDCLDPFVKAGIDNNKGDFCDWCCEEANRLLEDGDADPELLETLGEALAGMSQQFLGFHWVAPWTWPLGAVAWLGNLARQTRYVWRWSRGLLGVVRNGVLPTVLGDRGTIDMDEADAEEQFQVSATRLAHVARLWNHVDLGRTMEWVVWKLVRDSSVSRSERITRARALKMLGGTFQMVAANVKKESRRAQEEESTPHDTAGTDTRTETTRYRLVRAWNAATIGIQHDDG